MRTVPRDHRVRRVLPAAVAGAALLTGSGCAGTGSGFSTTGSGLATTGITPERLQSAFAPTFARLYVHQQRLEGRTDVPSTSSMRTSATCSRGTAAEPDLGAGSDWTCALQFLISGPGTPVSLSYSLTVRPDGCYTAEDPPSAMGRQTITTAAGRTVVNPVFAIDGCFATSS